MRVRLSAIAGGAAALGAGGGAGLLFGGPEELGRIVFLSVGQGDSSLIQSGDAAVLVDAGPAGNGYDAGARLVAPKLRHLGVERIHIVFLTHPDSDHIGGLSGLASRVKIDRVVIAKYFQGHPDLEAELEEAGIPSEKVLWLESGGIVSLGRSRLELRLPKYLPGDPDNEGSLFLKARLPGLTAVLTGDANEETELVMLGRTDWKADVLKAGHHGSGGSTGSAWLAEVQPAYAVASCGLRNRFGHPADAAVKRIEAKGAKLLRTDHDGDIMFEAQGSSYRVSFLR